jgi:hypothetical protein
MYGGSVRLLSVPLFLVKLVVKLAAKLAVSEKRSYERDAKKEM